MTENTNTNTATDTSGNSDEYSKPEQFCFAVELWDGNPIATICPIEYFEANGYLDDQYYGEIGELLSKNNFFPCLEATFEYDEDDATIATVTAKLLELGFKQVPAFDKYIAESEADFTMNHLMGVGAESEGSIEIEAAPEGSLSSIEIETSEGTEEDAPPIGETPSENEMTSEGAPAPESPAKG